MIEPTDQIDYILPDNFTIENVLRSFGRQLIDQSSYVPDRDINEHSEIVLRFNREILLGIGAMLLSYVGKKNEEKPS